MEARGKSKREENEEKEAKRRRRSVDSEDDKPRRRQKSDSRSDCQILCTINVSVMFVLFWKICTFIFRERVSY